MNPVSELVQFSKLETQFSPDLNQTKHIRYVSGSTTRQRSVRKEELWTRDQELGEGSFGVVWRETCTQGDSRGKLRAVKKIRRLDWGDYHRELEAIALFSHEKFEQCFVKSFGWYDDSHSIYITMEYLPDGDLNKYLKSPMLEAEGKQIVLQLVEGLNFMHDKGFAHRDLKPANVLVKCKGPDWWVKIGDFGISKRAVEGLTALRTMIGTPAFAAPEVQGLVEPQDTSQDSYTKAVDIWSLGVMAFLILTGETLFEDQRRLGQYVAGKLRIHDSLLANNITGNGRDFLLKSMSVYAKDRPDARSLLLHPWIGLSEQGEIPMQSDFSYPAQAALHYHHTGPSASWSTQSPNLIRSDIFSNAARGNLNIETGALEGSQMGQPIEVPPSSMNSMPGGFPSMLDEEAVYGKMNKRGPLSTPKAKPNVIRKEVPGNITARNFPAITARQIPRPERNGVAQQILNESSSSGDLPDIATLTTSDGQLNHLVPETGSPETTGEVAQSLEGGLDSCNLITISPYGSMVAAAYQFISIKLWSVASGRLLHLMKGHAEEIKKVTFSPKGTLLASGSYRGEIRIWDVSNGKCASVVKGPQASITAFSFSSLGNLLASNSGSPKYSVLIWDLKSMRLTDRIQDYRGVDKMAFPPGNWTTIAMARSTDTTVCIWDRTRPYVPLLNSRSSHSETLPIVYRATGRINSIEYSRDGTLLVIHILQPQRGECVDVLNLKSGKVTAAISCNDVGLGVRISPDGMVLALVTRYTLTTFTGAVRLWNLKSKRTKTLVIDTKRSKLAREAKDFAFLVSPDPETMRPQMVLVIEDGTLEKWDTVHLGLYPTLHRAIDSIWNKKDRPEGE